MKRLAAVFLLVAGPAFAQAPNGTDAAPCVVLQDDLVTRCDSTSIPRADNWRPFYPTPVQHEREGVPIIGKCDMEITFSVQAGERAVGPRDVNPGWRHSIHLNEGTTLPGPITIDLCDDTVTITGAPK